MPINVSVPHESASFIGSWLIDTAVCDQIVEQYTANWDKTRMDPTSFRNYRRLNNTQIDPEVEKQYRSELHQCLDLYAQQYEWSRKALEPWDVIPVYNVQMYEPGKHYSSWHSEVGSPNPEKPYRHLTFLTYLNDIEDGGGTEFLYQKVQTKPQKGLTVVWPAGWTHIHRGIPAPSERKYIVTGWCVFPLPKRKDTV